MRLNACCCPHIHDAVTFFTESFQRLFMAGHDWSALLMLIKNLYKLPLMHQTPHEPHLSDAEIQKLRPIRIFWPTVL